MQTPFNDVILRANQVLLDKPKEVQLAVCCLLGRGHLLIEDAPGVGKTTLVKVLASLLGLSSQRVQFTVDLLPADLVGGSVYNQAKEQFVFHPGPIFTNVLMADELNRASPRTQSALLQAMEENQVTVDGKTYDLPNPFLVIATQNPNDQLGTFPLPESQLDRFMIGLQLDYPSEKTEVEIFRSGDPKARLANVSPCVSQAQFLEATSAIESVKVSEVVAQYVAKLTAQSRRLIKNGSSSSTPLSTRAGILLIRAAKAWAFLSNRDFLTMEDIQAVLEPCLSHRIGGSSGLRKGREWSEVLKAETEVPI